MRLRKAIARRRMYFWLRVNWIAWPIEGDRTYRLRAFHGWLDPLFALSARRMERAQEDYVRIAAATRAGEEEAA